MSLRYSHTLSSQAIQSLGTLANNYPIIPESEATATKTEKLKLNNELNNSKYVLSAPYIMQEIDCLNTLKWKRESKVKLFMKKQAGKFLVNATFSH